MMPAKPTTLETFQAFDRDDIRRKEDSLGGRYDAWEGRDDSTGVHSAKTDLTWETKGFAEARRLARALAQEYEALHSTGGQ